jgi:hypothetical protein
MAIASKVLWDFIVTRDRGEMYWPYAELILFERYFRPQARTVKEEADLQLRPPPIPSPPGVSTMPRLRGKSRRGAAWYRAESRRKRIQQFEKALTLASIRRKRSPWSPPMAIVEEISLEEAMQSHPPIVHSEERRPQPEAHLGKHSVAEEDLYPPCIVEEEETLGDTKERAEDKRTPPRPPGDSSAGTTKNSGTRTSGDRGTDGPGHLLRTLAPTTRL